MLVGGSLSARDSSAGCACTAETAAGAIGTVRADDAVSGVVAVSLGASNGRAAMGTLRATLEVVDSLATTGEDATALLEIVDAYGW